MNILPDVRLMAACGVAAATVCSVSATPIAQSTPRSVPEIVVIGCVTQMPAEGGTQSGSGPMHPLLVITDTRSKPPRKFILQGTTEDLAWHVGHTLEIHGRAVSGESKDAAARDAQLPILAAQRVIYLQPTCAAPPH